VKKEKAMNICFFGTGHGVPEAGKKCASTIFKVGEFYYIIDAGCDVAYELSDKRIPFEKVKAIFITHSHSDHTNGLIPFMTITSWYYTKADYEIFLPSDKTLRKYLDCVIPGIEDFTLSENHRISSYNDGEVYNDGQVRVSAFSTKHCDDSHAFLVEAEGKRVLFTGDLRHPSVDFPDVDSLDAVIAEGAHFPVTDYETILKSRKVRSFYLNHYGNYLGMLNHANFHELKKSFPNISMELTTDGMEITV
jgi:ribonuclease BN (tRNA processing enzyme)